MSTDDYGVGVTLCSRTGKYRARLNIAGVEYSFGYHDTPGGAKAAINSWKQTNPGGALSGHGADGEEMPPVTRT